MCGWSSQRGEWEGCLSSQVSHRQGMTVTNRSKRLQEFGCSAPLRSHCSAAPSTLGGILGTASSFAGS